MKGPSIKKKLGYSLKKAEVKINKIRLFLIFAPKLGLT